MMLPVAVFYALLVSLSKKLLFYSHIGLKHLGCLEIFIINNVVEDISED